MKMQSYNIGVREAARYVLSDSKPADMSGYEPTGRTQEWNYTGDFEALKAQFEQMLEGGSKTRQRQCVLTRVEGDMAELVVTEVHYRVAEEEGEEGDEEVLHAGDVGTSAANPLYEYSFAETQEPMLTHPLIGGIYGPRGSAPDDEVMAALQYLAAGGLDSGIIYQKDGKQTTVAALLGQKGVTQTVQTMVRTPSYLDVRTRLTVSYEVEPDKVVGEDNMRTYVVKDPPGPVATPAGRDWLFAGGGYRKQGAKVFYSEVYLLSGPLGWDPNIYF